jgi:hypothetical protein
MTANFDNLSAKLNASFEAKERALAEAQARFQADVETRNAKLNADIESLAPSKPVAPPANRVSPRRSPLPRKGRLWMYPSRTR